MALEKGESLDKLEEVWEKEIEGFKNNREPYLLYPLVRK
jgi:hypothetical protein